MSALIEPGISHPVNIARNDLFLPHNAYIRALPFTVDIELRLRLDAIVFAADTIAAAYVRLFELALALGEEQVNGSNSKRVAQSLCF